MRIAIVIVLAACSKDPPPTTRGDYCRARNTFSSVPSLPPLSGARGSSIPAHTFSIVARDPVTGDIGVAVQSHWFSVGSSVAWAEAGVGAIATQSFVERGYGPKGLALMKSGVSAPDAMAQLVAADKGEAVRQLGFVDAQGRSAAHTGAKCIDFANHYVGDGFTVQANLMGNDKVVPAMKTAYETTKGDLTDRMLAALDAAQAVGGDIRGCQSAAIVVVSGKLTDAPWNERKIDVRVEDSPDPLAELHRLVVNARAYDFVNQGDVAVEKGDMSTALARYDAGMKLAPDNVEMKYWVAVTLASQDRVDEALPLFRAAFAADAGWRELTNRLIKPGIMPDTPKGHAAVERVLRDAK